MRSRANGKAAAVADAASPISADSRKSHEGSFVDQAIWQRMQDARDAKIAAGLRPADQAAVSLALCLARVFADRNHVSDNRAEAPNV